MVAAYGSVGASSFFLGLDAFVLLDTAYFLDFCSILMVAHGGSFSLCVQFFHIAYIGRSVSFLRVVAEMDKFLLIGVLLHPRPFCLGRGGVVVWLSSYCKQRLGCSSGMVDGILCVLVAIVSLCICWSCPWRLLAILAR